MPASNFKMHDFSFLFLFIFHKISDIWKQR